MDLDLASIGMHAMNIIILYFWGFMHQGCRTQRLTKSMHIFLYGQDLEDFVVKCNQWKYWMSFIACGCRFSRSYTVYSWLSKGWYWAFGHTKQCNDFPEWPLDNSLLLLNSQSNLYWTSYAYVQCKSKVLIVYMWQTTCQNIMFLNLFRNSQAEK